MELKTSKQPATGSAGCFCFSPSPPSASTPKVTIQVHVGAEVEEALLQTKAAETARAARAKKTRRTVVTGGVITVGEARRRIVQRTKEEEARKAREQRQLGHERRIHRKQIDRVIAKALMRIRRLNCRRNMDWYCK